LGKLPFTVYFVEEATKESGATRSGRDDRVVKCVKGVGTDAARRALSPDPFLA
jgi:hypothetical protein